MSHFFAYLSRMKFIRRWGLMHNTYSENVQEHSLRVAQIAHALALIRNRRHEPRSFIVAADELLLARGSQVTRQHQQMPIFRLHIDDVQIDQHRVELNIEVLAPAITLDVDSQSSPSRPRSHPRRHPRANLDPRAQTLKMSFENPNVHHSIFHVWRLPAQAAPGCARTFPASVTNGLKSAS